MEKLQLKDRNITKSHEARKERKHGFIPGVLYGKKVGNYLFEVGEMELGKELSSSGDHGIINYDFNGETKKGILKEVQRDPVTHKVMHIDLEAIEDHQEIQSEVPIQFIGEEWLNRKGQVLQKERSVVKVSCDSEDLPKSISIDVSKGTLGSVYKFSDLEIASELSIVDDINTVIAAISNEKKLTSELMEEEVKVDADRETSE